jgi:neutral ceramidase
MVRKPWLRRREFLMTAAAPTVVAQQPPAAGKLRAGAATGNITPNLGCSLAGNMTDYKATEVHDELHVRALVLDNGATQLAMVTCDLCVLPRDVVDRAKKIIHERCGLPPASVLVSTVHTHSAPPAAHLFQSQADPKYLDFLVPRIADAVRRAMNHLEPARIGWGVGREDRLVFNRRYYMRPGTVPATPFGDTTDKVKMNPGIGNPNVVGPAGPIDPDVGVLAVEALDGRPIAVWGNYALHYMGDVGGGHISADYFGYWARAMARLAGTSSGESFPPFVAMLTNACSGDINNIDVLKGSRTRLAPYVKMRRVAEMLAAESFRTWRNMEFTDSVALGASLEEIEFGVRLPLAEEVEKARRILAAAPPGELKRMPEIYARETVILAGSFPKSVVAPVQAMRIGALGIGTFPGEAFVELGLDLKAKSPFKPTLIVELANDYRGYIPTMRGFAEGGYETWRAKSSCLEKEAAGKITASLLRQLGALAV